MNFSLEELYGCSRQEYMELTDTTPHEMIRRLQSEVDQLKRSFSDKRIHYRKLTLGLIGTARYHNLARSIETKIQNKEKKIKDIKKEFGE